MKVLDGETSFKKPSTFARDFDLLKNVKNFHHQRVRQTILHNYNLALPNTNSKFFFPLPWERKSRENQTLPSTSGNDTRFYQTPNPGSNDLGQGTSNGLRSSPKISDCVQYTFPTIHEGLHHNGGQSAVSQPTEVVRMRKLKKNIPYRKTNFLKKLKDLNSVKTEMENDEIQMFLDSKNRKNLSPNNRAPDSESISSADEAAKTKISRTVLHGEMSSDLDQDGFQADESSNCMTSTENSLEKINISEFNLEKKDDGKS